MSWAETHVRLLIGQYWRERGTMPKELFVVCGLYDNLCKEMGESPDRHSYMLIEGVEVWPKYTEPEDE